MSRTYIKNGDIDLEAVAGITAADGWHAEYSGGASRPLLFWALLKDGSLIGVISEIGSGIDLEVRAADKALNFRGYRRAG